MLETYILEIKSVKTVKEDWGSYVSVQMKTDCYGCIEEKEVTFCDMEAFEKAKKLGYYMS